MWTWKSGSSSTNQSGTYGALGAASASNTPGGRDAANSWTDAEGNIWLFGGLGFSSSASLGYMNDLWKYSPGTGQWTWESGSIYTSQYGSYGVQGTAANSNTPGAREAGATWTDASGNLWLFGGSGVDANGSFGALNDLWKFTPSAGQWTWVGGSNVVFGTGSYGTLGTAASGNIPGARADSSFWKDASGNFWLFGGQGVAGFLNDLWKYTPGTGQWTWMGGSSTANQSGSYGSQGIAAAANLPGGRGSTTTCADAAGNVWLYGGLGLDVNGTNGRLGDLWKYSNGQWTWMSGADIAAQLASYGTQGVAAAGNQPGARNGSVCWVDSSGSLWLFAGWTGVSYTYENDLWKYSGGQWTWVSGSNQFDQTGVYGTQGTGASGNIPGARAGGDSWADSSGNVWIFGGVRDHSNNGTRVTDSLNDLWEYTP